jgi:hypothetical protein
MPVNCQKHHLLAGRAFGIWRPRQSANTMMFTSPQQPAAPRILTQRIAIAAVLLVGLFGGLLHHHDSESELITCSYCHVGSQRPIADLAVALTEPSFAEVGYVTSALRLRSAPILRFSTLIPRAPPASTQPASIWESPAGLA